MAIVLTSTTSSQEEMNRVVSAEGDEWRKPPVIEEPKPDVEETKADAPPTGETDKEGEKGIDVKAEQEQVKKEHRKPTAKEQARWDRVTKEKHEFKSKWEESESRHKTRDVEFEAMKRELAIARGEIPEEVPETKPVLKEYRAAGKSDDEFERDLDNFIENEKVRAVKVQAYNKAVEDTSKKYPDWNEAAEKASKSGITFNEKQSKAFWKALEDEPSAPDVLYYIWKHQEDARAMANGTPDQVKKIVGKILERVSAANSPAKPVTEKPKVKPPEPIAPVGASATRQSIPLDQLPPIEYNRVRDAEEARNKRRR